MNESNEWPIDRFLREVAAAAARDDRGCLAELRRGLSPTTEYQAWEHLIPRCADFEQPVPHAVWCTIGGLAALLVPAGLVATEPWNNLGTAMRALAKGTGENDEAKALKTFEPKFRRLLSCTDAVPLCGMVAGIGRTAAVKGVPVNLKSLFWDLWNWNDPEKRERIRLNWATQYFRVFEPGTGAAPAGEVAG